MPPANPLPPCHHFRATGEKEEGITGLGQRNYRTRLGYRLFLSFSLSRACHAMRACPYGCWAVAKGPGPQHWHALAPRNRRCRIQVHPGRRVSSTLMLRRLHLPGMLRTTPLPPLPSNMPFRPRPHPQPSPHPHLYPRPRPYPHTRAPAPCAEACGRHARDMSLVSARKLNGMMAQTSTARMEALASRTAALPQQESVGPRAAGSSRGNGACGGSGSGAWGAGEDGSRGCSASGGNRSPNVTGRSSVSGS